MSLTPNDGQRLLFSATLDGDVATLIEHYLTNPAAYALDPAVASVDTMSHHLFRLGHDAKFEVISEIVVETMPTDVAAWRKRRFG